mgnify:CR=1 FL=1
MIDAIIQDGFGSKHKAMVTQYGQLVVGALSYSTPIAHSMTAINTAYNFATPISGKRIVITDILMYANKGVGANDAAVEIYEAAGDNETTVLKTIISTEMLKQTSRDFTGLNLIVSDGVWLNAKTDDNIIYMTIMYYYIPVD